VAPLADQQLAGLIMWVPADLIYLSAAGTLFMRWLVSLEHTSPRRQAPDRPAPPATSDGRPWRPASQSPVGHDAGRKGDV
jgi:hypothetical protein